MMRRLTRLAILAAAIGAACGWSRGANAQDGPAASPAASAGVVTVDAGCGPGCQPWQYGNPDLFYNFYVPNNCGVPAAMYVAPRPVPQTVGHTYYTYQPLMPHEFMYSHYRTYRKAYDDGRGINRTNVKWYSNPVSTTLKDIRWALTIPR